MKKLIDIIQEKLKLNSKTNLTKYNYTPQTKEELQNIVKKLIRERGVNADLNDIDTSNITDMSCVFVSSNFISIEKPQKIDISKWDVSNVTNTWAMFSGCENFNCDLSEWDVSKIKDMTAMFKNCYEFDASCTENWNIRKRVRLIKAFKGCKNLPSWYDQIKNK